MSAIAPRPSRTHQLVGTIDPRQQALQERSRTLIARSPSAAVSLRATCDAIIDPCRRRIRAPTRGRPRARQPSSRRARPAGEAGQGGVWGLAHYMRRARVWWSGAKRTAFVCRAAQKDRRCGTAHGHAERDSCKLLPLALKAAFGVSGAAVFCSTRWVVSISDHEHRRANWRAICNLLQ